MKLCILGDSVAKGVIYDWDSGRYTVGDGCLVNSLRAAGHEAESFAVFGCTAEKGLKLAKRHAVRIADCELALLEFGGNECDFNWCAVGDDPAGEHLPKCSHEKYAADYERLVSHLREAGAEPVAVNLPPIDSKRYFARFSREMSDKQKQNVLRWLGGDVEYIHRWHASYNDRLGELAARLGLRVIDVRAEFCRGGDYTRYLCADGIHPNAHGQGLLFRAVAGFLEN